MPNVTPRLPLSSRTAVLKGAGPARVEALREAGLETLRDLLWSLPYRYVDRGTVRRMDELDPRFADPAARETVTVLGVIRELRQGLTRVRRMVLTEAILDDGRGQLKLVWFNQPYLGKALRAGDRLLAFGPLVTGRHGLELRAPAFEIMGREGDDEERDWIRRFIPLYRKLGPLTSRVRGNLVQEALAVVQAPQDYLPAELARGLPDLLAALRHLHQPPDESDPVQLDARATPAHARLAAEELFAFALGVALRRTGRLQRRGVVVPTSPELRERIKAFLPFRLTGAQRQAFKEIVEDLTSGRVMHRLLQGDVGSGKTLVAFLALAMVAETGGQGALLVPTEILARQHAATFQKLLGARAESLQLLLGALRGAETREALDRIARGEARYVVGTHALFQEAVAFRNLQLIVVDEQHRFGVRQREALKAKGVDPHWLVMSATPIPRSLALALFGDLDQSVLDELPPGRQPVATRLLDPADAERAWDLVERELKAGRQAFVVSPAIDPTDESRVRLRDIQAMEALLRARFPDWELQVVHGRLKAEEMEGRMDRFVTGAARILLATTVIEVGVDVPNATVMVVDHAERFGLSQLHQLRGRVGRGGVRSHFVMLSASETERLQALVETHDGFRIAQRDLELRGPGEFFGTRQSGIPQFQVADLVRDRALLSHCREAADLVLQRGLGEAQREWLMREWTRLRLADVL